MDSLLDILGSFNPDWKGKKWVNDFGSIIKEMVLPTYPFLCARLENSEAVFSDEWHRIVKSLKTYDIFIYVTVKRHAKIGVYVKITVLQQEDKFNYFSLKPFLDKSYWKYENIFERYVSWCNSQISPGVPGRLLLPF